jgi:predicted nucleic acid-binding Zn ribbon protein
MEEKLVKAQEIVDQMPQDKIDKEDMTGDIEKGLREVRSAKPRYQAMLRQAEQRTAAKTVRNMLSSSDWSTIYEQRDHVLKLTRKSGRLSPEDLSLFENDPGAWAKELNQVWKEQQTKAKSEL